MSSTDEVSKEVGFSVLAVARWAQFGCHGIEVEGEGFELSGDGPQN